MSKKAPSAPDPVATAQAQGQANADAVRESAKVNAINQYTPYGSVIYERDANGVPTSQTTTLTPLQQQALEQQNQLATILGGQALTQSQHLPQDKYSLEQFGPNPATTDYTAQGNTVRDAYFQQQKRMLDPVFAQERGRLEQNIANGGLPITGEAATTLEDNLARRQNDALSQAANNAIIQGGNEQSRLFNLDMAARQQGISEYNAQRQQPFNELSAYLQGQPIFQAPSANMAQYQVAPADIAGSIYQNYNAQNQTHQNNLNGMYSLIGAGAMAFSDRRLKRDIRRIGKLPSGLNVYRYRYLWSDRTEVGVMADEARKVSPQAVSRFGAYDMIDYGRVV